MLIRSFAPPFNKEFSFDLPQPELIKLNNGLDLIFFDGISQEVFKIELVFKAAKWQESKGGLSHFTATLLEKGTTSKSSREIAYILDSYGAQLEITPGYDFTSVTLYGLKKTLPDIFPLFMDMVISPAFSQNEFDLQKEIFIQNLKVNNEKNSFIASKLIRKNVFGSDHPYGSSIDEKDVNSLTVQELGNFFEANFSVYEIYLLGNFSSGEVHWLSDQFSSLTNITNPENNFSITPELQVQKIEKKESVQNSIRLGKRIVNRNHSDYFALLLLNHILGGYFGSRLMKNIREEKGLTYGIYSSINPFKNDCLFSIGADVGKEKLDLALSEIKKEIKILSVELIPEEELIVARNHFLGSLQLEVANPFSSLDKIKNIRLNNLGYDYYLKLFSALQSLSSKNIQSIAAKYFSSDDFYEVFVG